MRNNKKGGTEHDLAIRRNRNWGSRGSFYNSVKSEFKMLEYLTDPKVYSHSSESMCIECIECIELPTKAAEVFRSDRPSKAL